MEQTVKPMFTLATARSIAGIRLKDAAKELGISERTLISYEHGRTRPHLETILQMVDLYGIPQENLIIDLKNFDLNTLQVQCSKTNNQDMMN